ncbi:histone-lysine N-methyltransferase EZA1 isoform X2 [Malania oleifera]|uniref:histone-lysine N-methyltransferase EZA1 isoform X2 n=1 Tax=Malania oleifera TaxID=397392 RepID=UPI0025AE25A0|nr:histone-lysine N-methyltransferase EZA1 isoform X2 [Malania oleifera]
MKSQGEHPSDAWGDLTYKIYELKKQIQDDRVISIKAKLEKNGKILEQHLSQLVSGTLRKEVLFTEHNGLGKMLSLRIEKPLCMFSGFSQGYGDKDYVSGQDVVSSAITKLPYVEKIPPYTTWIFLDRNQRMAEDQSVVGRRRIYYDQYGSEALVCSDSEEEITEAEEEKHEFSEGEDRIIWMAFHEHGSNEGVVNIVSQCIGGTTSEIQERYSILKDKLQEKQDQILNASGELASEKNAFLEKSLSSALDSFDNLFCRRCLVFDCRLHGCSQTLINPSEKQSYWAELEENGKPCSDQCYLRLRSVKDLPESSRISALNRMVESTSLEEKNGIPVSCNPEEPNSSDGSETIPDETCNADKTVLVTSEVSCNSDDVAGALNADKSVMELSLNEGMGKRKALEINKILKHSKVDSDGSQEASHKKQKKSLALKEDPVANESIMVLDSGVPESQEFQMTANSALKEVTESKIICSGSVTCAGYEAKDAAEVSQTKQILDSIVGQAESNSEWKPIEKELYLKGIEMFGRNSCLIARNLLSGLKTCIEVFSYMYDDRAAITHRSVVVPSSLLEDNGKAETDYMEQEVPTRSRLLRKRGRTRKLKYSWKSAGHPSIWKRIAGGKNLSCKQYTPCGCQFMCGKQCPCLHNGTCCEKYCGCSKSCKNRFRGCHCAKSQCRSRQCPCFAAGRECDPDVCRNCWVSCGDGSLGEPPRRGDGQCGNMRLLLRQQQNILLAKSDVAGWGAFIKKPVNKNDYLGEYTGELISHREADKRGKIYDRANSSFLFDLNDQYVLDAYRKGDKLKFANHSSNPNCYAKVMLVAGDHRVGIFAKEHIEASEELFYDYRYGPDQAPAWARKPETSKRDDSSLSQGRPKKHQSH